MHRSENAGGIALPDTVVCRSAVEVLTAYSSSALVNDCLRSYIWGAPYAQRKHIAIDAEPLLVAAMLHDIGLEKEFDSPTVPFEEAGGHVAWVFGAGAGWPVERRQRAAEIIVRHMWSAVEAARKPGRSAAQAVANGIAGRLAANVLDAAEGDRTV